VKLLTTNRVFFSFIVSGRLFREKWPAFFCYISPRKKKKKKKKNETAFGGSKPGIYKPHAKRSDALG
jgi:hypothetical protein